MADVVFEKRVLAMIPAPGFERVHPPAERRMRDDKFTTFKNWEGIK